MKIRKLYENVVTKEAVNDFMDDQKVLKKKKISFEVVPQIGYPGCLLIVANVRNSNLLFLENELGFERVGWL